MKRILVISNACFSDGISNGKTLVNLFDGSESKKLAQFFVYGAPDSAICDNYYQVSDKDALHSLNPFKKRGGIVKRSDRLQEHHENIFQAMGRKTPLKMLIREMVWKMGGWNDRRLKKWVDDFNPEALCLFLANNVFLVRFAIQLAKQYRIPVIVYTTEAYYFMDFNYLTNQFSIAYKLYHAWLRMAYKKLTPYVQEGYFNSTVLRDLYENEFHYPCKCVMNKAQIDFLPRYDVEQEENIKISYLGNLGLRRHLALIEIARTLQELNPNYYLDIYGAAPNDAVVQEMAACQGIRYHGYVTYDEVVQIIHNSTLLVHTEFIDPIANRDLKYAFSTKIADSISSGTPLFLYASESLAGTVFLKENDCAFIVADKTQLKETLYQALTDRDRRYKIIENARLTREKYLTGNEEFRRAFE